MQEQQQSADSSHKRVCAFSFSSFKSSWPWWIVALAGLVAGLVYHELFTSPFDIEETAYVYVHPDDTEDDVLEQLRSSAQASQVRGWYILRCGIDYTPRSGRYAVHKGENWLTMLRRLRGGSQEAVRLTLPSVRTLDRLAGFLASKLMLDSAATAAAFSDSTFAAQYGYTCSTLPALFIPNTYELFWNISLDAFMQRMQRENDAFWNSQGRDAAAKSLGMTHEEVVTLASIVDEETAYTPEKPRVAGAYLNRLRIGMLLQADPTVKFAVGDATLRRIRGEHLRVESPYNTYLNKGLPPGPIRIPSVAGIDAVLHMEDHDYLYMCAKEDFSGTHNFAATFPQHQQNARRYQKALNERGIR